jgi:hypothetical protein
LLKPPSYREPDKLISVYETCLPSGFGSVSAPTSRTGASISHAFEQLESLANGSMNQQSEGNLTGTSSYGSAMA